MRCVKDLLKDMGFNADAPEGTKDAFLKHLMRAAQQTGNPENRSQDSAPRPLASAKKEEPQQLSFDPEILGLKQKY